MTLELPPSVFLGASGLYSEIETGNDTGITSNSLGDSLALCEAIVSILHYSLIISIIKAFF